MEDNMSNQLLL